MYFHIRSKQVLVQALMASRQESAPKPEGDARPQYLVNLNFRLVRQLQANALARVVA